MRLIVLLLIVGLKRSRETSTFSRLPNTTSRAFRLPAGALSLQVHLALKDLMTTRDVLPENWLIAMKVFWAKKLHLSVDSWLP
jgi:hypothetical protein